jgi:hypothetical protein
MRPETHNSNELVDFLNERQLLVVVGESSATGEIFRITLLNDALGFSVSVNYQFDDATLTPVGFRCFPKSPSDRLRSIMEDMPAEPGEPDTVFVVWFVFESAWDGKSLPRLSRLRVGQLSRLRSFDWAAYEDFESELESRFFQTKSKKAREFTFSEGLELSNRGYSLLSGRAGPHSLSSLVSKLREFHLSGDSALLLAAARSVRWFSVLLYRGASLQPRSNNEGRSSTPVEGTQPLNFAGLPLPKELTIVASVFWSGLWIFTQCSENYSVAAEFINTAVGAPLTLYLVATAVGFALQTTATALESLASQFESESAHFARKLLM